MRRLKFLFLGCGFLASHLIPHVLPFSEHLILVDRERVERENYENSILPKGYVNRRKVTALASLVQVLSSTKVTLIHTNVRKVEQLLEMHEKMKPEFCFVTFDNFEGRAIAREYALKVGVPTIFVGVTEGHAYVDWAENVVLPEGDEVKRVREEMRRVRDVCSRIEFRGLGFLASSLAFHSFTSWFWGRKRLSFMVRVGEGGGVEVCTIPRNDLS